jgi:hypothetical protein
VRSSCWATQSGDAMRIRVAIPDSLVGPSTIGPTLESVTRLNQALLRQGLVPRLSTLLRRRKVRWAPEPRGHGEHFDAADTVVARGWGDCDDLAPFWAAELRETGVDPHARVTIKRTGPHRWHAIVRRSDGSVDDPSAAAGMPSSVDGVAIAHDRPLRAGAPVVDVANWPGWGWLARADLPLGDYLSLAHYAVAPDPRTAAAEAALSGACHGACHGIDDAAVLGAVASHVAGWPAEAAADNWGVEVGSLFGSIAKGLASVVTAPVRAVQSAASIPSHAADSIMQTVPGLSAIPAMAQGVMQAVPGLQSVMAAGLPLAQQLLPLLSPGLGPAGLSLPVLQAILSAGGR